MKSRIALPAVLLCLLAATVFPAEKRKVPTPGELIERLTAVVRKHCPEAEVTNKDGTFVAEHGTMVFTVHRHYKTGEYLKTIDQEEGPNYRGFILKVEAREEPYRGGAAVPQDYRETYWRTYFDHAPGVSVWFSYGSRVDRKLKAAVLAAMPRPTGPARPRPVDPKEKK